MTHLYFLRYRKGFAMEKIENPDLSTLDYLVVVDSAHALNHGNRIAVDRLATLMNHASRVPSRTHVVFDPSSRCNIDGNALFEAFGSGALRGKATFGWADRSFDDPFALRPSPYKLTISSDETDGQVRLTGDPARIEFVSSETLELDRMYGDWASLLDKACRAYLGIDIPDARFPGNYLNRIFEEAEESSITWATSNRVPDGILLLHGHNELVQSYYRIGK